MIHCTQGSVEFHGSPTELLAEYSVITHTLKELFVNDGEADEDDAINLIQLAYIKGITAPVRDAVKGVDKASDDLLEILDGMTQEEREDVLAEALRKALGL